MWPPARHRVACTLPPASRRPTRCSTVLPAHPLPPPCLSQAYQVLGTPDLRHRYDAHGQQGLDVNFMDGSAFFSALFGSDRFEHLVRRGGVGAVAAGGRIPVLLLLSVGGTANPVLQLGSKTAARRTGRLLLCSARPLPSVVPVTAAHPALALWLKYFRQLCACHCRWGSS